MSCENMLAVTGEMNQVQIYFSYITTINIFVRWYCIRDYIIHNQQNFIRGLDRWLVKEDISSKDVCRCPTLSAQGVSWRKCTKIPPTKICVHNKNKCIGS